MVSRVRWRVSRLGAVWKVRDHSALGLGAGFWLESETGKFPLLPLTLSAPPRSLRICLSPFSIVSVR